MPDVAAKLNRGRGSAICPSQQERDDEAAEGERADGGDGLPVHACEYGKASATGAEDGGDPVRLIDVLTGYSRL